MCRITGIIGPDTKSILRMRDSMAHGGPDDAGLYEEPGIALAHRRLSIIDRSSAGHQPMASRDGQTVIAYNGELYNFIELRQELQNLGRSFNTRTDTEVIVQAFEQWGTDCFNRFNGMFALAIYDRRNQILTLARDHAGIKPLYYATPTHDTFVFASETRAFKQYNTTWPENPSWKPLFLTYGHLPEPHTALEGVKMLPRGCYLQVDCRQSTVRSEKKAVGQPVSYLKPWTVACRRTTDHPLRTALQHTVHAQLVSDAPIGLFLSGGIDSSVLTFCAQPVLGDNLRTSSLVFDESKFSELPQQQAVARASGAHHEPFTLTQRGFEDSLDDALAAMDQTSTDGLNSYFVCRKARAAGLTVALSGLGADELLGGYPSFQYRHYVHKLRLFPKAVLRSCVRLLDQKWQKAAFLSLPGAPGENLFYRGLFHPADTAAILGGTEAEVWQLLENQHDTEDPGDRQGAARVSWIEQHCYMQNQLLRDTDAMSMWHSLEVRVPFLDRNFTATCAALGDAVYDTHPPKKVLIDAFPELPRMVWDRPKRGFTLPFEQWLRGSERFADLGTVRERFEKGQLSWSRLWGAYLAKSFKK